MVFKHILEYTKTGESPKFTDKETDISNDYIATLMKLTVSNESRNEGVRERVALELIHAEQLTERGGWDGKKGRRFIEVKSESQGTKKNLSGTGRFNQLTWDSFEKYRRDDGIYLAISYDASGQILYAIAFDMHHLIPKMTECLLNKVGKNVNVCISHTDFPEDFEVLFLRQPMILDDYSSTFGENLVRNYYNNTTMKKVRLTTKPKPKPKSKSKAKAGKKVLAKVSLSNKIQLCYGSTSYEVVDKKATIFFENRDTKTILVKSINAAYRRLSLS